ncbi:MAG: elongation factor 1-beta [Candidatus Odinarchaeia archaeon]
MGKVLAVIKIMPEDVEVDLEKLKEEIIKRVPSNVEFRDYKIEPFAFGIKVLRMGFTMADAEGGTSALEEAIRGTEGVGEVEVEHVTLI